MTASSANNRSSIDPKPDPTHLTTKALLREISTLDEKFEVKHKALIDKINTFESSSKESLLAATNAIQRGLDKSERGVIESAAKAQLEQRSTLAEVEKRVNEKFDDRESAFKDKLKGSVDVLAERIKSLAELTALQFNGVANTFAEKDKAVLVGLSAQKESAAAQQQSNTDSTSKMENNFTKLLDQGRELLAEVRRNNESQISDIKSRLDKGEGKSDASTPALADTFSRLSNGISTHEASETKTLEKISESVVALQLAFNSIASKETGKREVTTPIMGVVGMIIASLFVGFVFSNLSHLISSTSPQIIYLPAGQTTPPHP